MTGGSGHSKGETERCERCNRKLSEHASVTVGRLGVTWICPTTDGYAVSEEVSLNV
jgi:hypothetical protein